MVICMGLYAVLWSPSLFQALLLLWSLAMQTGRQADTETSSARSLPRTHALTIYTPSKLHKKPFENDEEQTDP